MCNIYYRDRVKSEAMASSTDLIPIECPMEGQSHITEKMNEAQTRFEKACKQIILLDQRMKGLEVRYKLAVRQKNNSFRYNLRSRLSVVTGLKMMYHHYASTKAEELTLLRRQFEEQYASTPGTRD